MQNSNEGELKMGRLVLGQGAMAPRARGALSSRSAAPPSARATSPRKDEPPRPMSAAARAMDALQKKIVAARTAFERAKYGATTEEATLDYGALFGLSHDELMRPHRANPPRQNPLSTKMFKVDGSKLNLAPEISYGTKQFERDNWLYYNPSSSGSDQPMAAAASNFAGSLRDGMLAYSGMASVPPDVKKWLATQQRLEAVMRAAEENLAALRRHFYESAGIPHQRDAPAAETQGLSAAERAAQALGLHVEELARLVERVRRAKGRAATRAARAAARAGKTPTTAAALAAKSVATNAWDWMSSAATTPSGAALDALATPRLPDWSGVALPVHVEDENEGEAAGKATADDGEGDEEAAEVAGDTRSERQVSGSGAGSAAGRPGLLSAEASAAGSRLGSAGIVAPLPARSSAAGSASRPGSSAAAGVLASELMTSEDPEAASDTGAAALGPPRPSAVSFAVPPGSAVSLQRVKLAAPAAAAFAAGAAGSAEHTTLLRREQQEQRSSTSSWRKLDFLVEHQSTRVETAAGQLLLKLRSWREQVETLAGVSGPSSPVKRVQSFSPGGPRPLTLEDVAAYDDSVRRRAELAGMLESSSSGGSDDDRGDDDNDTASSSSLQDQEEREGGRDASNHTDAHDRGPEQRQGQQGDERAAACAHHHHQGQKQQKTRFELKVTYASPLTPLPPDEAEQQELQPRRLEESSSVVAPGAEASSLPPLAAPTAAGGAAARHESSPASTMLPPLPPALPPLLQPPSRQDSGSPQRLRPALLSRSVSMRPVVSHYTKWQERGLWDPTEAGALKPGLRSAYHVGMPIDADAILGDPDLAGQASPRGPGSLIRPPPLSSPSPARGGLPGDGAAGATGAIAGSVGGGSRRSSVAGDVAAEQLLAQLGLDDSSGRAPASADHHDLAMSSTLKRKTRLQQLVADPEMPRMFGNRGADSALNSAGDRTHSYLDPQHVGLSLSETVGVKRSVYENLLQVRDSFALIKSSERLIVPKLHAMKDALGGYR